MRREKRQNEESLSTERMINDNRIYHITKIQEMLYNLPHFEDINYKVSLESIKELDIASKQNLNSFIRNVIRYSMLFPKKIPQYIKLLEDLEEMHDMKEAIKNNVGNMYKYGHPWFTYSLIDKNILNIPKVSVNQKLFSQNFCKNTSIEYKGLTNRLMAIISSDNVESLKELAADPNFFVNYKLHMQNSHYTSINRPTLIQYAAYQSSIQCFKFLYSNKADLNNNIMKYAIAGGSEDIIKILEQNDIKPIKDDILISIEFHQQEIFDWLLEQFPGSLDEKSFEFCSKYEFAHCLSMIPSFKPNKSFRKACRSGFFELASLIVENYEVDKTEGLFYACKHKQIEIVRLLHVLQGIEFMRKIKCSNIIIAACESGEIEIVKMILSHPEINVTTVVGETFPLLSACRFGYLDIVKLLVEQYKANVNQNSGYDDESKVNNFFIMNSFHYLLHADMGTQRLLNSFLSNQESK